MNRFVRYMDRPRNAGDRFTWNTPRGGGHRAPLRLMYGPTFGRIELDRSARIPVRNQFPPVDQDCAVHDHVLHPNAGLARRLIGRSIRDGAWIERNDIRIRALLEPPLVPRRR